MNATVQVLIVFVIVATATTYSALKFMPKAWRQSVASQAARAASRMGLSADHARRVEAKLATGGACGSCDSCNACAAPTKEGDAAAFAAAPPSNAYRRIPIRHISS